MYNPPLRTGFSIYREQCIKWDSEKDISESWNYIIKEKILYDIVNKNPDETVTEWSEWNGYAIDCNAELTKNIKLAKQEKETGLINHEISKNIEKIKYVIHKLPNLYDVGQYHKELGGDDGHRDYAVWLYVLRLGDTPENLKKYLNNPKELYPGVYNKDLNVLEDFITHDNYKWGEFSYEKDENESKDIFIFGEAIDEDGFRINKERIEPNDNWIVV